MKIGIIGAMDVEVSTLKDKVQNRKCTTYSRMEFCEGFFGKTNVVIVKSGVGKVNAGLCVQILADRFGVTHIINTGVAGSLNNDINIGDIVVSVDATYHDVDATIFGYAPGEIPQLGVKCFHADDSLRKDAVTACRKADPDINVFEGIVASGDQFISDSTKKSWIRKTFVADCCEMEGAAIAQASFVNQIPFVIIRAISDKADESVTVSYDEFEGKAAVHCADLVSSMIENM